MKAALIILCLTAVDGRPLCMVNMDNIVISENVPGYPPQSTTINTMAGVFTVKERLRDILDMLRKAR